MNIDNKLFYLLCKQLDFKSFRKIIEETACDKLYDSYTCEFLYTSFEKLINDVFSFYSTDMKYKLERLPFSKMFYSRWAMYLSMKNVKQIASFKITSADNEDDFFYVNIQYFTYPWSDCEEDIEHTFVAMSITESPVDDFIE